MKLIPIILGICLTANLFASKVELLTPPILQEISIDQKFACTRPMREGKFNISTEEVNGKRIVHCYGHGGSGCTTLFGSVERSIELYEKEFGKRPKAPIRVVGSGIIGLTTAIELTRRGYEVAGITAKELYNLPSWKNAGNFALVSVQTDPEEQANLNRIGMASFIEYKKIYEGKHPYISSDCIRYIPVYCSEETEAGVEDLERIGLIPPREYVSIDFGNGVVHHNFIKFMTYFMDTTHIMLQLRKEVDRLGIKIQQKTLNNFNEVAENVIFNCSGLGAKQLNHDNKMVAVRGHLANLNHHSGTKHMDYMIYTKVKGIDGKEEYVYLFPKCLQVNEHDYMGHPVYGTLGGTFIRDTDHLTETELERLDKVELKKLLDRNSMFFWGKPFEQK
jgi:D-amino-acid oxidase